MIYIPLAAFLAAVGWMVWRGFESKKEYLRGKKLDERERGHAKTHS